MTLCSILIPLNQLNGRASCVSKVRGHSGLKAHLSSGSNFLTFKEHVLIIEKCKHVHQKLFFFTFQMNY